MAHLQVAMIPVFKEMAEQKKWGHMPLPLLVEALTEQASVGVLQSDQEAPEETRGMVSETELYFEVSL
jgi:hypothetical protein